MLRTSAAKIQQVSGVLTQALKTEDSSPQNLAKAHDDGRLWEASEWVDPEC